MRRPVYDGLALDAPIDEVVRILGSPPRSWLPAPAEAHPHGTVVTMHASGILAAAGVPALVDVGPLQIDLPGLAVLPIAWRALYSDRVFPRLVGELEVTAISDTTSRLTLVGSYQPPISVVGGAADRLLGHHLAAAVIRSFLERVGVNAVAGWAELAHPAH